MKNTISRNEAAKLAPDYVSYIEDQENQKEGWWNNFWDKVLPKFNKLKVGRKVLTYSSPEKVYVICKISSMKMCWKSEDGPVVRVTNGEFSWRVDGDRYAYPI